jgi:AraC-like DNA-binding protein
MKHMHRITSLYHGSTDSGISRITTLALLEDSRGTPGTSLRKLDSYALVYVYEGHGFYQNRHQHLKIRSGDLILIQPDDPHAYGPTEKAQWNELFLLFEGTLFDLWSKKGLLTPTRPVINLQPIPTWSERFKSICTIDANPLKQACRLQTFLAEALEQSGKRKEDEAAQRWIDQVNKSMFEHLTNEDAPKTTARSMGLSYEGFRKKYKRITGIPPGRFCTEQIMAKAAKKLMESDQPIRVIAEELGFCDEFHFSRRFKQVTGSTPRAYRSRLP